MTADARTRPHWRRYIALALVGILGGLFSGAFGVGGGVIMVPLLIWLVGTDQRHAAATSLVAIVPTGIAGSANYLANGAIDVLAALLVAVGGIAGSLIGTRLLRRLPLAWLRWLFIALLVAVAVRMAFELPGRGLDLELTPLVVGGLVVLGLFMGIAAGLFGIGGGVIAVPALIALFGVSDLLAKGTSLLALVPAAITGSIANLRARLVRLVDGLVVGVFAVGASFAGVALAFWMDPRISSVLFAALILFTAVQLSVRAINAHRSARRRRRDEDLGDTPGDAPTA